ncbi:MAG: DNA photolyase [Candidatus Adiutrix sp.]|jgi:spore photoproduct lyase|nr:DNA photolyase [Candidatus Adiutrix sp.]
MTEKRLWLEPEFAQTELADNLARGRARQVISPVGSAGYNDFGPGDLLLTRHRGSFIKPCPGTLHYNCCGLQIFHFGLGCSLGCRYCILSAYLGTEALVLFGNVEEGLAELAKLLSQPPAERPHRFCTGEFTDSLLLDRRSGLAGRLIQLFAGSAGAVLELKTKTDQVDHLLSLNHRGRTVISFSVNAPEVCAREESRAAPLPARLAAARRAAEAGYPIGLHFDPLIFQPGWEEGYQRTIDLISRYLGGRARVAWVSLGCFRYLPALKEVMLNRHPGVAIYDAEFITGGDGKMRYPRPRRTAMYRAVAAGLRRALPDDTVIYLCMESPRLWRDVFGQDPGTGGLTALLDRRALEFDSC